MAAARRRRSSGVPPLPPKRPHAHDSAVAGNGSPAIDFTLYFLPGMIAAGIMLVSFQTLAISIALEREDGTLKRLRGTPMPPVSYFLGKIGLVLVTAVAQTALLLAFAALIFGVALPTQPARWLTFAWVFVLGRPVDGALP